MFKYNLNNKRRTILKDINKLFLQINKLYGNYKNNWININYNKLRTKNKNKLILKDLNSITKTILKDRLLLHN